MDKEYSILKRISASDPIAFQRRLLLESRLDPQFLLKLWVLSAPYFTNIYNFASKSDGFAKTPIAYKERFIGRFSSKSGMLRTRTQSSQYEIHSRGDKGLWHIW